jgi:hypothetical protein
MLTHTLPFVFFTVKVKVPRNRPEGPEVGRGIALLFPDLGARRGWVVSTTPRPLYPQERPGIHCTGGWVGPRAGLDVCEKSHPPPGFDPRTVQPVASRYTDWAIPAPIFYCSSQIFKICYIFRAFIISFLLWIFATFYNYIWKSV